MKLGLKINNCPWISQDREIGNIPVMVRVSVLTLFVIIILYRTQQEGLTAFLTVKSMPPRKSIALRSCRT